VNEPVLLLIFGHGDEDTHGIEIGLNPDDRSNPLLSMQIIKEVMQEIPHLRLSALLTSCYSGAWTRYHNMTTVTAAGNSQESESWPHSVSLSRVTGSIYASAIVERLQREEHARSDDSMSSDQVASYRQVADEVKAHLLLLDRFGDSHKISFSAQDNDRDSEYHGRTGIPVTIYRERLEKLRCLPTTDRALHSSFGDRSSDELKQQRGETVEEEDPSAFTAERLRSLLGRYGGSKTSVQSILRSRAARYLASYPGRSTLASNVTVHVLAVRCLQKNEISFEELAQLADMLDHREKVMKTAHLLLDAMQLEPFPAPWLWDVDRWMMEDGQRHCDASNMSKPTTQKLIEAKLFPKPGIDEGRFTMKPIQYLAAAMQAGNLAEHEVDQRIAMGQTCTYR
jgi:hypothetical protein